MKRLESIVVIFSLIVLFIACTDDFSTFEPMQYDGKFPDESAKNMEIIFSDSGRTNFIINANLLNKYISIEEPYMDFPEGVKVVSFDEYGKEQSILTADYAISFEYTEQIEAHKNVVITNVQKRETIETEKIIWDKRNKRIYSDVEVRQTKADGTINIGDGFESDEYFSKYSIKNPRMEMLADDF